MGFAYGNVENKAMHTEFWWATTNKTEEMKRCVLGRQRLGRAGGRAVSVVCADFAVVVSVSTREIITLRDADCPRGTGKLKSLLYSLG